MARKSKRERPQNRQRRIWQEQQRAIRELQENPRFRAELQVIPKGSRLRAELAAAKKAFGAITSQAHEAERQRQMKARFPTKPEQSEGGRPRRLTDKQVGRGISFLNRNPGTKLEDAYPALRKLLHTDASDSTLWRRIWSKRKR
jgi:hypothetical protein